MKSFTIRPDHKELGQPKELMMSTNIKTEIERIAAALSEAGSRARG